MDSDDKDNIENQLELIKENNKNIIFNNNKQIEINNQFNNQITSISNILDELQINSRNHINDLKNSHLTIENDLSSFIIEYKIKNNIDAINNEINKIKDCILASRLNILSHDILSYEEKIENNITIEKFSEIKLSLAIKEKMLLFILSIPIYTQESYQKIKILPIPNKNNTQIEPSEKEILKNNGKIFSVAKKIRNLNLINETCLNSIFQDKIINCHYRKVTEEKIIQINNELIVTINTKNEKLEQNCGNHDLKLTGIFLIKWKNCQISIKHKNFSNYIYEAKQTIILPNIIKTFENNTLHTKIDIKQIQTQTFDNINELKEIKTVALIHSSSVVLIIIVIIVLGSVYLFFKLKKKSHGPSILLVKESRKGGVIIPPEHTEQMHEFLKT